MSKSRSAFAIADPGKVLSHHREVAFPPDKKEIVREVRVKAVFGCTRTRISNSQ
jgi:hypothetical protein